MPEGGDGDDFDEVPIEVEKILGHKVDGDTGKVKYHVQLGGWQGKIEANGSSAPRRRSTRTTKRRR